VSEHPDDGVTPAEPAGDDPLAHDRMRRRRARRIAGFGSLAGVVLSLGSGLAWGTGRVGLAVLLLVSAFSCAAGAGYATVTLLVDQVRGRHTSGRRAVLAGGLFLLTAMLMAMLAGAGG
jgi:hypothetical protein